MHSGDLVKSAIPCKQTGKWVFLDWALLNYDTVVVLLDFFVI